MPGILDTVRGIAMKLSSIVKGVLDAIIPPDQRAEMLFNFGSWANSNPKLASFLIAQIALSGLPLLLFVTFGIAIFLFTLTATLLIGILVSVFFTTFAVGFALLVLLPTIFVTTFSATFVYLCGLGAYYVLTAFRQGRAPARGNSTADDKLDVTDGRITGLTNGTRKENGDASTEYGHKSSIDGSEVNGNAKQSLEGNQKEEKMGKLFGVDEYLMESRY